MTQFVEQLRNQAKWYAQPGHNARDLMDSHLLEKAADEIECLRAKIAEMEQQEPVGTLHDDGCFVWRETAPHQSNYAGWKMVLYALPGAQPAPSVPMDVIADYLVSISAHLARRDDAKAQAEIGELLKMIASAPKPEAKS